MLTPFQLGMPANSPPADPIGSDSGAIERQMEEIRSAALAGKPLKPLMVAIMQALGFEHFVYATTTISRPTRDSRSFVWTTMPWEWMAKYDQNAYVEIDPRITLTLGRSAPFVWDSAEFEHCKELRAFFADAAAYGTRSGVSIAFSDPAFARVGVGFNSSISPVHASRRQEVNASLGDLMIFAARFHDMFVANHVEPNSLGPMQGVPLSPRERQCLVLAARGMASPDIGIKLDITARTVGFHFSNIVSKLGAINRMEAVAIAVSKGLIRVDS